MEIKGVNNDSWMFQLKWYRSTVPKVCPQTSRVSITWQLARNSNSPTPSQTYRSETVRWAPANLPGDSDAWAILEPLLRRKLKKKNAWKQAITTVLLFGKAIKITWDKINILNESEPSYEEASFSGGDKFDFRPKMYCSKRKVGLLNRQIKIQDWKRD